MGCVLVGISILLWFILHSWIGLSVLTTISIIISVVLFGLLMINIKVIVDEKKQIKQNKLYKAKFIDKNEIKGYNGETTYTLELNIDNNKRIIEKQYLPKKTKINDVIDVYPICDNNGNIVDFDYFSGQPVSKLLIACNIISIIISVILVLNNESKILETISIWIGFLFFFTFCLFFGIHSLKRYYGSKNPNLIVVDGKIVSIRRHTRVEDGIEYEHLSPIYQVMVNGETYQFLGDKNIRSGEESKYMNSIEKVFYDSETMEFYDKKSNKSDLALAIIMLSFAFLLLISFLDEIFNIY